VPDIKGFWDLFKQKLFKPGLTICK